MGESWGHGIASASADERREYTKCEGKCECPVVFRLRYNYVTGRRGRVGVRERYVCESHGRKFAAKYGVTDIPDPAIAGEGSRRRANMRALLDGFTKSLASS